MENKIQKLKTKKGKTLFKQNLLKPHKDTLEREDNEILEEEDSKIHLNDEELEDEKEGGKEEDNESEEEEANKDSNLPDSKEPTSVEDKAHNNFLSSNSKLEISARLNRKKKKECPESPLPVIIINSKQNKQGDDTKEVTVPESREKSIESEDEEAQNTFREMKEDKNKRREKNFINLRMRYDGFNKMRFVYSKVIPR